MNELASLGLILLFALLAGHLVKFLRVPEVLGYILAGMAVGPGGLGWVTPENLSALQVFAEVALGLILFSIGSIFEFRRVLEAGIGVLRITLSEGLLAAVLVTLTMLAFGLQWQVALLLGAIGMSTSPDSTLMVIRECNASGPLTSTLLGVVGTNNILCLTMFALVAAAIDLASALGDGSGMLMTLYMSLYPLVWQLVGSVALGFLVGLLLASWATRVTEHGEMLILLIGCVLLCVGTALVLELSTLVASLAVGATMVNLSANSRRLFQALSTTDPPFYAIFFVIAGADLNPSSLGTVGLLGFAYVAVRAIGKFTGATIGARQAGFGPEVHTYLGFGLMAQAGLAIGLTLTINRRFPEFAPAVSSIVLAAITLAEIIGPIATRLAIVRSGEANPESREPLGVLD